MYLFMKYSLFRWFMHKYANMMGMNVRLRFGLMVCMYGVKKENRRLSLRFNPRG